MWSGCLLNALCNGLSVGFFAASYVDPAGNAVAWHDGLQARVFGHAPLDGVRAARLERAARWRIDQVGRQALDRHELFLARLVQARDRLEQAERVGGARVVEGLVVGD